jgi:hypothetical protein
VRKFPPEWPTPKAIETLTQRLALSRKWSQDWELEVTDASRIGEFCRYYEESALTIEEKFALMALIVASFDDYLQATPSKQHDPSFEAWIERLLRENFVLHSYTVEYWSVLDAEDWFPNPS